jgi:hypothetical protein
MDKVSSPFYTRAGLWRLFLLVALPIHIWAMLMALRDIEPMTRRTNFYDAIGFFAYILLIALAESIFIYAITLVLSGLLPWRWSVRQRVLASASLSFIVSLWFMLYQLNYWNDYKKGYILDFIMNSDHVIRYGAMIITVGFLLVAASIMIPIIAIDRSLRFVSWLNRLVERLIVLSTLYLVLDVLAALLVLYRNII